MARGWHDDGAERRPGLQAAAARAVVATETPTMAAISTLFLDLFDRMHQLSQQQLASLNEDTPGADTATS